MAPLIIGALIGAAMGGAAGSEADTAYKSGMKTEAMKERYSPWTHQPGQQLAKPNMMGSIMSGASMGAAMGQKLPIGGGDAAPAAPAQQGGTGLTYPTQNGQIVAGPPAQYNNGMNLQQGYSPYSVSSPGAVGNFRR